MEKRELGPVYVIRVRARPGNEGIRSLKAALKALWRRYRLRCVGVEQEQRKSREQR